ncbi:MAG: primosomal protein N' [Deltaproteobacteria bacterium]|nr:primosomal protein N' [Deltaproteobacteria bacterium]
MRFVDVLLPLPLAEPLTYLVPEGMEIPIACRVLVPLGKRKLAGVVVRTHNTPPSMKTKPIEAVLDTEPLLSPLFLEWIEWASRYYLTPPGEVLASALPSSLFSSHTEAKLSLKKMRNLPTAGHWVNDKEIVLNQKQKTILESLKALALTGEFHPALLHGVTGSGKTEIYLKLLQSVVESGRQAIFLVPEIGLTPQIVARFSQTFGDKMALTHSGLTENQRLKEWTRARRGEVSVIVGTRSALFAPFGKLGAIILDEEHDSSYKQEERFRYHARDLAVVRAKMEKCLVLLGSATPSLESFQNAREGKYRFFSLPERAGGATVPQIKIVDLAAEKRQGGSPLSLSRELMAAVEENLKKKEQTLILMNRRGFARSFFCLACETPASCPNCSVNLVYHRNQKVLLCHYCDFAKPLPEACPACKSRQVTLIGSGTETAEEELKSLFPSARIARLDRDTTQKKGVLLKTLRDLKDRKIDILVGTQMIAKGHDIPHVTLVGVLAIDAGLGIPDFRASERTFQLLMQVSGRSGRAELPGQVIVQAYGPDHYSIQLACKQDYEAFFQKESALRAELGYPPSGKLIQFKFSSASEAKIKAAIQNLDRYLAERSKKEPFSSLQILGPAPAPLERIRGRVRWHLLLKGKGAPLKNAALEVRQWLVKSRLSGIKWAIDVDPVGML